jgi:WhiB family redox-sensing transcriptional regulator
MLLPQNEVSSGGWTKTFSWLGYSPGQRLSGGLVLLDDIDRLPLADLRDRVLDADPACMVDPVLFTGPNEDEEPADDRAVREMVARQMCGECPVRKPCLAYALVIRPEAGIWAGLTAAEVIALADEAGLPALARREPFGVWGGLTEHERRFLTATVQNPSAA